VIKVFPIFFSFIFILINPWLKAQDQANPISSPYAQVIYGNARFTVLTPELIRLEWSMDGKFTDDASLVFINRKLNVPPFEKRTDKQRISIITSKLTVRYSGNDSFSVNNLEISSAPGSEPAFSWKPGMKDTLNLKGTMRTLDGVDKGDISKLEEGIISRSGWALVNDSRSYLFDGDKQWNWVKERRAQPYQDWYFFGYGHAYKKALTDFTKVAGKIPLPPRFAFGYWWSRYWIYSDQELRRLAQTFDELDIPLDVMIIDMDWHETYNFRGNAAVADGQGSIVGWTGYTWNKDLFPDPGKLLNWMGKRQIRNALNLHPSSGIPPMEEKYPAFAKAYGFDTTGHQYIPYYGSDKKWSRLYFDSILHPFEKIGVDFWWLDWQQHKYDLLKKELNNTWWLNYMFFTDMQKQGKRPLLFHRWGGLGNHRYQIGFSGDSYISWHQLAFQPWFTSTASNVGYGYWSHDIGGHQPGDPGNNELFRRWMQWGVFSPILRTHSTKKATIDRQIWKMKDDFLPVRELIRLRYTLNPYIYASARTAYETGISLCRPMYYDHPGNENAYQYTNQYMFGEDILVSPIVSPADTNTKLSRQSIWLPPGTWFEWFTGTIEPGDRVISKEFAADEIPVYVKAGSIIPAFPSTIQNLQKPVDTMVLFIFGKASGETTIYEDDQDSEAYRKRSFAKTRIEHKWIDEGRSRITIFPRTGNFKGMRHARAYEIRLPITFPPSVVKVNGKNYSFSEDPEAGRWNYNGSELQAHIFIPMTSCNQKIVIELSYDPAVMGRQDLLNNKVTVFKRMRKVMEMLKYESSRVDWGAALPDAVLYIEQTPTRIDYDPRNTAKYLREMESAYPLMLEALRKIPDVDQRIIERIIQYLPGD
jgi:alpha-glucosidase (family GH31 glycosyl hydrolase)